MTRGMGFHSLLLNFLFFLFLPNYSGRWMTCDIHLMLTVFQLYQDDGWLVVLGLMYFSGYNAIFAALEWLQITKSVL